MESLIRVSIADTLTSKNLLNLIVKTLDRLYKESYFEVLRQYNKYIEPINLEDEITDEHLNLLSKDNYSILKEISLKNKQFKEDINEKIIRDRFYVLDKRRKDEEYLKSIVKAVSELDTHNDIVLTLKELSECHPLIFTFEEENRVKPIDKQDLISANFKKYIEKDINLFRNNLASIEIDPLVLVNTLSDMEDNPFYNLSNIKVVPVSEGVGSDISECLLKEISNFYLTNSARGTH